MTLAGCTALQGPEGEQIRQDVMTAAAHADSVLGIFGLPSIVGDLASVVLAVMMGQYGWKKVKNSEKGKIIG